MSEWLEAITKLRRSKIEKPEKGFITREEVSKQLKLKGRQIDRVLREMVDAELVEVKSFAREMANGVVRGTPHYRLKR